MKLYKLTNPEDQSLDRTQWGEGVTHTAPGDAAEPCTASIIYAYADPLLAVFMDPAHGGFGPSAHLWEADGDIMVSKGTRLICKSLTTLRRIDLPVVTMEQRTRFAILCAKAVYKEADWNAWADAWLDGTDRSAKSARSAAKSAWSAAAARSAWSAEVARSEAEEAWR